MEKCNIYQLTFEQLATLSDHQESTFGDISMQVVSSAYLKQIYHCYISTDHCFKFLRFVLLYFISNILRQL